MVIYPMPMINSEDFREFLLSFAGHNPKYLIALSETGLFIGKQAQVSNPLPLFLEEQLPKEQLSCLTVSNYPKLAPPHPALANTLTSPFPTNLPSPPVAPNIVCGREAVTTNKGPYGVLQPFLRTIQQEHIQNRPPISSISHEPYPRSSLKHSFNTIISSGISLDFSSAPCSSVLPRRQRAPLACQQCRKKKKKCSGETDGTCKRCYKAGEHCSFVPTK